jgi:glucose-6-phosphate 1-dehydrogenase
MTSVAPRRKYFVSTPAEPFTLIIFGASGDLTARKLIPAVYNLFKESLLPEKFSIIGFARHEYNDDSFRRHLRQGLTKYLSAEKVAEESWQRFAQNIYYNQGNYDNPPDYQSLKQTIEQKAHAKNIPTNCLFYLATPPAAVTTIVGQLRQAGLARRNSEKLPWSRLIVEKPFGHDLDSARKLNHTIKTAFHENQIYRIDHYLGKETVQNLLVFRFANMIFEPIWNHNYIDHVQITVSETLGVEGRGAYYERSGALRDIVQNHMMHLLCLVAMEAPNSLDAVSVRNEKVKVLKTLRPIPPECAANGVVRAQYDGYLAEAGVAPNSTTETYVAFKAFVDNWRWSEVPFYLRTGKRMPTRITEIGIHFKPIPNILFNAPKFGPMTPNILAIRIQPNEGISLQFQVKEPGLGMKIDPYKMDFSYSQAFGKEPPDAYERLILDAGLGDSTLFTRDDEVEAAWTFVEPILLGCSQQPKKLPSYPAGSWGPKEADDLIAKDSRFWHLVKRPK